MNDELTDELLQQYADGKFELDVQWRGAELAKELLEARRKIRELEYAIRVEIG